MNDKPDCPLADWADRQVRFAQDEDEATQFRAVADALRGAAEREDMWRRAAHDSWGAREATLRRKVERWQRRGHLWSSAIRWERQVVTLVEKRARTAEAERDEALDMVRKLIEGLDDNWTTPTLTAARALLGE